MLPKSIIKKYGISKKAWAVYRGKSRSIKRTAIKQKIRKMAKKKHYGKKSSGSILGVNTAMAIGALAYGAAREKTSQMVAPYTAKLPLGNVSDEAMMLIITTLGKKFLFKNKGIIRDALSAGQVIEIARIGEAAINGQITLGGTSESTSSNGYIFA